MIHLLDLSLTHPLDLPPKHPLNTHLPPTHPLHLPLPIDQYPYINSTPASFERDVFRGYGVLCPSHDHHLFPANAATTGGVSGGTTLVESWYVSDQLPFHRIL